MKKIIYQKTIVNKTAGFLALLLLIVNSLGPAVVFADGAVSGVSLDKESLDLCPGDTFTLTATVAPPEAPAEITWSTSDIEIAEVSGGVITAKAVGMADITAISADGVYTAVCSVTVKAAAIALTESSVYTADRSEGLLKGVSKFTPLELLLSNLENAPADIGVLDKTGKAFTGTSVGTGMTLTLTVNGTLRDSLKIIVSGDANGDGAISISDYTLARLDILGLKKLAGVYMRAGDVNGDGVISITDYTMMRLDILGLKPIGIGVELPAVSDPRIKKFLDYSYTHLGKPYVWGAEGPDVFDCSGFVYYCLNQAGYKVGRSAAETYSKRESWLYVSKENIQPGDLLFFFPETNKNSISHVAIYLGNGYINNASYSYGCVIICPLSGKLMERLSHGRRVFR